MFKKRENFKIKNLYLIVLYIIFFLIAKLMLLHALRLRALYYSVRNKISIVTFTLEIIFSYFTFLGN